LVKSLYGLAGLALTLLATDAGALTLDIGTREISAKLFDFNGNLVISDSDSETVFNDDPYQDDLAVFIGGSSFNADVQMSRDGYFGIAGATAAGELQIRVNVQEIYRNDGTAPVQVSTTFLVNGGLLALFGSELSSIGYSLEVGTFPIFEFDAEGELRGSDPFFVATFSETGDSLGAIQATPGGSVEIPLSFNTVDMGVLQPGDTLAYAYDLRFTQVSRGVEIAFFEFRDPTATGGATLPPSPFAVTATPVSSVPASAVPAPAALPLLASVVATGWLAARRRRRLVSRG